MGRRSRSPSPWRKGSGDRHRSERDRETYTTRVSDSMKYADDRNDSRYKRRRTPSPSYGNDIDSERRGKDESMGRDTDKKEKK